MDTGDFIKLLQGAFECQGSPFGVLVTLALAQLQEHPALLLPRTCLPEHPSFHILASWHVFALYAKALAPQESRVLILIFSNEGTYVWSSKCRGTALFQVGQGSGKQITACQSSKNVEGLERATDFPWSHSKSLSKPEPEPRLSAPKLQVLASKASFPLRMPQFIADLVFGIVRLP